MGPLGVWGSDTLRFHVGEIPDCAAEFIASAGGHRPVRGGSLAGPVDLDPVPQCATHDTEIRGDAADRGARVSIRVRVWSRRRRLLQKAPLQVPSRPR